MSANLSNESTTYARIVLILMGVLFAVGAVGHFMAATLPLMLRMTPVFLLGTGLLVLIPACRIGKSRFVFWAAGTYVATYAAEAIGVATGAVFGDYAYGETLGFALLGVPLVIAFNWVLVVFGAACAAERLVAGRGGRWRDGLVAGGTGLLATGFDAVMEPVAIHLDYWTWAGGAIPLQNYGAWFVIAALSAYARQRWAPAPGGGGVMGRLAMSYVLVQAMFFVILRLVWLFGTP